LKGNSRQIPGFLARPCSISIWQRLSLRKKKQLPAGVATVTTSPSLSVTRLASGGIVPEDIVHLPFETSREPLTPAAQRCAFCTNVVKNSVGKGEKNVGGCVYFSTHEVMQSITKCNTFFGRLTHFREGLERDPSLAKALDRCIISDASNKLFWT
jgi:hypothetical protein